MECKNKTVLYIMIGFLLLILVFAVIFSSCGKKRSTRTDEPFQAPDKFIKLDVPGSSYTFKDYGFGTPLLQTDWEGPGLPFQPALTINQGLYDDSSMAWKSPTQFPQ